MIKGSSLKVSDLEHIVVPAKKEYKCPSIAVDIIIECKKPNGDQGFVFIERKNPPHGFALPGGFVDYGEALYDAAIREAKEETGLDVSLHRQLFAYSHPERDPRQHVISVAYFAMANGEPQAADDAKNIVWVPSLEIRDWLKDNKEKLVCDHYDVVQDHFLIDGLCSASLPPEVERKRWTA